MSPFDLDQIAVSLFALPLRSVSQFLRASSRTAAVSAAMLAKLASAFGDSPDDYLPAGQSSFSPPRQYDPAGHSVSPVIVVNDEPPVE